MEKVLNMEKIECLGLMEIFKDAENLSSDALKDLRCDIVNGIKNIDDVVNMHSNNGWGWVDKETNKHAEQMIVEDSRDLPALEVKLSIVKYFLQNNKNK